VLKRLGVILGVALLYSAIAIRAQPFPMWERVLQYYGAKTDETPVPSMKMGTHMQMSMKARPQRGDEQRAAQILAAARNAVAHYADVNTAVHDGYKPFHPTGKMGEEVHYTSYRLARREQQRVDYEHPGSILYKRTAEGMKAVGVMYSARQDSSAAQLNVVVPLSVAVWHRHVDFCGGPRNLPIAEQAGPDARFGALGGIHTEEACREAHGLWIPVVFGWMTHVYPNETEHWGGMDMHMNANTDNDDPRDQ
jgi:hypothetical protein